VRAVQTALKMRQRLKEMNHEKFTENSINIRIGINTGRVVAGDIGSPKRIEYTVLGNTVNIASRLESSVAKPGQIVVGKDTYSSLKDQFEIRELGEFSLKGLEKSSMVYEVIREKAG
jgi:adenylate cyclase